MAGVAAIRREDPSLEEQVIQHEATGRHHLCDRNFYLGYMVWWCLGNLKFQIYTYWYNLCLTICGTWPPVKCYVTFVSWQWPLGVVILWFNKYLIEFNFKTSKYTSKINCTCGTFFLVMKISFFVTFCIPGQLQDALGCYERLCVSQGSEAVYKGLLECYISLDQPHSVLNITQGLLSTR